MLHKLLCFVLFLLFIVGCSSNTSLISEPEKAQISRLQTTSTPNELKIIRSNTKLKAGDMGFITIQGKPGVRYKIESSFKVGKRVIPVTQWRVAGTNGQATFNWVVSSETTPGNYAAVISGNGKALNVSHAVLP
jgi:hypothetical protein